MTPKPAKEPAAALGGRRFLVHRVRRRGVAGVELRAAVWLTKQIGRRPAG